MNLTIKEYKIQEENIPCLVIHSSNAKLVLTTDVAMSSSVVLKITGIKRDYYIPVTLEKQDETGTVFGCSILFTESQVSYMRDNPTKVYTCTLYINNTLVEGSFNMSTNPQFIFGFTKVDNQVTELCKKVNLLESELYTIKKSYPSFTAVNDLVKGTVPIATGVGNEYIWDYPLANLTQRLKSLTELVSQLAEQNANLAKSNEELTKIVNDHIYEEYNL